MSSQNSTPEAKYFAKYLEGKKIVIADPSAAARSGLVSVCRDLGAKTSQITLVNSFKQAVEQIEALKPHIVLAEYQLGKRCGLDLLQTMRVRDAEELKSTLFVLITGNTSQSAVARAAEEDIDAYIIKPFTVDMVRKLLIKAAMIKLKPPNYLLKIEEGKKALSDSRFEEAEKAFNEARTLDPSPALACYYLGHLHFIRKLFEDAKGDYKTGLNFNKIHYKCMVGLYELLASRKEHAEAYEVVKRISQYFPANPKRLAEVLRLAIVNAKYEDVEKYYAIFCNIDERDDMLIRYICAALVVCGRFYLGTNSRTRALDLFTKAAATGTGRTKILKEVVQALIDFTLHKEARLFLSKFPAESQTSPEYLVLDFQLTNAEGNSSATINKGRAILAAGVHDAHLFAIMIQRSLEARLIPAAETLFHEAVKLYPDKKPDFEALVQRVQQALVT
jgi:CheY-like chemotaxis protein